MFSKKNMIKKLLGDKQTLVKKMTKEYIDFLSNFDKERTIKSITVEEIKKIAERQYDNMANML